MTKRGRKHGRRSLIVTEPCARAGARPRTALSAIRASTRTSKRAYITTAFAIMTRKQGGIFPRTLFRLAGGNKLYNYVANPTSWIDALGLAACRGRIQAQGKNLEESVAWNRETPPTVRRARNDKQFRSQLIQR